MVSANYSAYYLAEVERSRVWFFVAILRSFENVAFDRTVDKVASQMEIFVAPDCEAEFLDLMHELQRRGVVLSLQAVENRLMQLQTTLS